MLRLGSPSLARGLAALSTAAVLTGAALAAPQGAAVFYRAYYLEHEQGDLAGALELYRAAAGDANLPADARARAAEHAAACAEELAAGDLARLVPEDTIFYLELNEPGGQLGQLLDQLGLLQGGEGAGAFGISPHLLEGTLGLRGAAVAVTRVDPTGGMPGGIAILHPGDMQAVRGIIETALPAGGEPTEAIDGHATFLVEGMVHVTLTDRLVLASTERQLIADALERARNGGEDSFADHPDLAATMALRGDDLVFFCLNAEPIIPLAQTMLGVLDRQDPEAAMGIRLLDIESLEAIAGRIGVGEDGVSMDMGLQLAGGHRNLAFNMLRMPHVGESTFDLVPAGAAFFMATSLNAAIQGSAGVTDSQGAPVVSFMDIGREIFGNLRDVAIFGLPSLSEGPGGQLMPDVALTMRVNDAQRSRAIWELALGVAKGASGRGNTAPLPKKVAGVDVHVYEVDGVDIHLYAHGDHVVLSPSLRAIEGAVRASRGENVAADPVFAALIAEASSDHTSALGVSIGRCAEMVRPAIPARELREIGPILDLLGSSTFTATTRHSDTQMAWSASLEGLPNVGPLVEQMIRAQASGGRIGWSDAVMVQDAHRANARAAAAEEAAEAEMFEAELAMLRARADGVAAATAAFEELSRAGKHAEAIELVPSIGELLDGDANGLNDFVWNVVSSPVGPKYAASLLPLTERSNELSDRGNWYFLDTLAHVKFFLGDVDEAIAIQEKAVAIAKESRDPRLNEAVATLTRFRSEI